MKKISVVVFEYLLKKLETVSFAGRIEATEELIELLRKQKIAWKIKEEKRKRMN